MVVRRRPHSHISLSCNGLNVSLEVTTFLFTFPSALGSLKRSETEVLILVLTDPPVADLFS